MDSTGLLNIEFMLGEVESLLGGLAGGIAKRQESFSEVLAVGSMLLEVESLLSSLAHGIAKR